MTSAAPATQEIARLQAELAEARAELTGARLLFRDNQDEKARQSG